MNNAGIWIKDRDKKLSNSVDVICFDSFQYHDRVTRKSSRCYNKSNSNYARILF